MPVDISVPLNELAVAFEADLQSTIDLANGALGSVNIFPDTTAGLAATTDGQYFSVPSADSSEHLILYKNNSGAAAEVKRYPSSAAVSNLESGVFTKVNMQMMAMPPESGYAWAIVDSNYRAALLVGLDGTISFPKFDKRELIPQTLNPDSGYAWAVVDQNDKVALGVDTAGRVVGNIPAISPEGIQYLQPSKNIWCLGDSLTEASTGWRTQLASLISARTITNGGIGGQTSTQIAARAGGVFSLLTLPGNQIPASGSVSVTAVSNRLLSAPSRSSGTLSVNGWLAGVYGALTCAHDASNDDLLDVYTFTRATSGVATYCPPSSAFVPDVSGMDLGTLIICVGTNNIGSTSDIISDFASCIGVQKTAEKRFLLMSPVNSSPKTAGASPDTSHVNDCIAIESALTQKYGDRVLRVREFSWQFNDGSADDLADVAAGCVPRSLRLDAVHWNEFLHVKIAEWLASEINRRGW